MGAVVWIEAVPPCTRCGNGVERDEKQFRVGLSEIIVLNIGLIRL